MGRRAILVTGSAGMIGRALSTALSASGPVRGFDLVQGQDVRDAEACVQAAHGCVGVVHLAAMSRVAWGQSDPTTCHDTNAVGTAHVVAAAQAAGAWVALASSREVYGRVDTLPVSERAPLAPVNAYGRSKVAAEQAVERVRADGAVAAVVRLSNVYGDPADHLDRVVPAFCRAALSGQVLRVEGAEQTFDFVHLDDAVAGLMAVVDRLSAGQALAPVHLVTGQGTTLGELSRLAISAAGGRGRAEPAAPRTYDVARFVGDPRRAQGLLGWSAQVGIEDGVRTFSAAIARRGHPT